MANAPEDWTLLTEETDDGTPAIDRYLSQQLAARLRKVWTQVGAIVLEYKRGKDWLSAAIGVAMPAGRKNVTPEGGAEHMISAARDYSSAHAHKPRLRLNILGESQSGGTQKSIFILGLDFRDEDDTEDAPTNSPGPEKERSDEMLAILEILRVSSGEAFKERAAAVNQTTAVVEQVLSLCEQLKENSRGLLRAQKAEMQDRKKARKHERKKEEAKTEAARTDKLFDVVTGIGGRLIEDTLRTKYNMGDDTQKGPFSARLKAILTKIPPGKLATVKQKFGYDAWEVMDSAAGGVDNAAFTLLIRRLSTMIPGEPMVFFKELAVIIGDEGIVVSLGQLLNEAAPKRSAP